MDFAAAIVQPPQPRCIGVAMRPFSLGHKVILQRAQCAFVTGGEFPTYEDLITGAFVCSHTWEENERLMRSPFKTWLILKLWGWLAGKFNVAAQMVIFADYIQKSDETPPPKKTSGAGLRELASTWETRLYGYLRSIGYSHSEALNAPLAVANALFVAHLEETGSMEFKSLRDYERDEALLRAEREAEASGAFSA